MADDTRKRDAKNLADFKKYCSGTGGGCPTPQPKGTVITICFMGDKNLWDGTLSMSIFLPFVVLLTIYGLGGGGYVPTNKTNKRSSLLSLGICCKTYWEYPIIVCSSYSFNFFAYFSVVDGDEVDTDSTYSCAEPGRTQMSYSVTSSGRKILLESQELPSQTPSQISPLVPVPGPSFAVNLATTEKKRLSYPSLKVSPIGRVPKPASATITSGSYQNSNAMVEHAHMVEFEDICMEMPRNSVLDLSTSEIEVD